MDDVARRYPSEHYVLIDDKIRILTAVKKEWGSRLTTVFPRQGRYAHAPEVPSYPGLTWEIRYLVVDTRNWWIGKKVLVAPHWASRTSWDERRVHVDMSRQAIKDSPEWNPTAPINREYEARLYDYYGRPAYWSSGDRSREDPSVKRVF